MHNGLKRTAPFSPTVFIDESRRVVEGAAAHALIESRLDREHAFFNENTGIAQVDRQRWEEAQRYERRTWMQAGLDAQGDRNRYHKAQFNGYSSLRGRRFGRAIELGCGPFTNMRFIHQCCRIEQIHLLDPLLGDYLKHPYCQYAHGRLGGVKRLTGDICRGREEGRFICRRPWLLPAAAWHAIRTGGWQGKQVMSRVSMIEEFEDPSRFDLVVIVNVLEHCQNGVAVLEKILNLTRIGSVLVFGDLLFDADEVRERHKHIYDVGHPLRIERRVIQSWRNANFRTLYMKERLTPRAFYNVEFMDTELYFIGERV